MTARDRIKTSDIRAGMHLRVMFADSSPDIQPARNLRDSEEVEVLRCDHVPGRVPNCPYHLIVQRGDGSVEEGYFPGFQTHMRSRA
jgi:hypothetical protein